MQDVTCNGWANHATWETMALISNVEYLYNRGQKAVRDYPDPSGLAAKLPAIFPNMVQDQAAIDWEEIAQGLTDQN